MGSWVHIFYLLSSKIQHTLYRILNTRENIAYFCKSYKLCISIAKINIVISCTSVHRDYIILYCEYGTTLYTKIPYLYSYKLYKMNNNILLFSSVFLKVENIWNKTISRPFILQSIVFVCINFKRIFTVEKYPFYVN